MWIVSQIGAREHYGIARALHRAGQLGAMVTDFWVPPGSIAGRLPGMSRLKDRFHEGLEPATVHASNTRMLAFEGFARLRGFHGWERMTVRNAVFQREAVGFLSGYRETDFGPTGSPITLFSYSYAALELFRMAKKRGWKTVLGQIDPGPGEDAIVRRLRSEHPEWAGPGESSPPATYWRDWQEECDLADRIIVNSPWSGNLLRASGIESEKIEIIPLALEGETGGAGIGIERSGLSHRPPVSDAAPLKILWLGQAIVRKGIQDLAAAASMLQDQPVRIEVVGTHGLLPRGLPDNLLFHGAVPRSSAAEWYRGADLFVLPTHSDGFALTQLEAMAHGLPVIATRCCGEVVEDGVNGWLVPSGEPKALADLLRQIIRAPDVLAPMSLAARKTAADFNLDTVAAALLR